MGLRRNRILKAVSSSKSRLSHLQDIRTAQHGYGVRNINFRLKLCFGEKYGVTYLESEKGTHVEIKIPVMTMAEAEEKI